MTSGILSSILTFWDLFLGHTTEHWWHYWLICQKVCSEHEQFEVYIVRTMSGWLTATFEPVLNSLHTSLLWTTAVAPLLEPIIILYLCSTNNRVYMYHFNMNLLNYLLEIQHIGDIAYQHSIHNTVNMRIPIYIINFNIIIISHLPWQAVLLSSSNPICASVLKLNAINLLYTQTIIIYLWHCTCII